MKPHLEEAERMLQLADRDIKAFEILKEEPEAHISIVGFHAQQAVEKSLKAVLFSQQIEFERIHDLVKLGNLVSDQGIVLPVKEDQLRRLNPFAVTFRYDDMEITLASKEDTALLVADIRRWAEEQVNKATESEQSNGPTDH